MIKVQSWRTDESFPGVRSEGGGEVKASDCTEARGRFLCWWNSSGS